jgi:hypothetical protein
MQAPMDADTTPIAADNPMSVILRQGIHCHEAICAFIGGHRRGIGVHRRLQFFVRR